MKGAIFYATRYGSTSQYAQWIAEATGLHAYNIEANAASIADFDFLVLGSPVIYHKLMFWKWVRRHLDAIAEKPVIVFTVSGVSAGEKLDGWIADSLPQSLIDHMHHVALRGRQDPRELSRYDRMMLIIGSLMNRDRQAAREELHGFDFMERESIGPVVELVERFKAGEAVT